MAAGRTLASSPSGRTRRRNPRRWSAMWPRAPRDVASSRLCVVLCVGGGRSYLRYYPDVLPVLLSIIIINLEQYIKYSSDIQETLNIQGHPISTSLVGTKTGAWGGA